MRVVFCRLLHVVIGVVFLPPFPTAREKFYANGLQITELLVPETVKNGSEAAVLDCIYTLRPEETKSSSSTGLVIKWFFDSSPTPVYQWIPGQNPRDLGLLRGRLDLKYRATSQPVSMHRALRILHPTTELSGEYKCTVSTFDNEDFMIKKMIVYAPEKVLEVFQSQSEQDSVNISCRARGLYPQPRMSLFRITDSDQRVPMDEISTDTLSHGVAGYDITATGKIQDEEFNRTSIIECIVFLPGTSYSRIKSMIYYPGHSLAWTGSGSQIILFESAFFLIAIHVVLFLPTS